LLIRARTSDSVRYVRLFQNLGVRTLPGSEEPIPFLNASDVTSLMSGGGIHTYRLRVDRSPERWGEWVDPWRELVLVFTARNPGVVEILSVRVVSKAAAYGEEAVDVRSIGREGAVSWTLSMHAPGSLAHRFRMPAGARLDFGLGTVQEHDSITFRVTAAEPEGEPAILFEERYAGTREWAQRSVDLSRFSGRVVDVALEADADRAGAVALWSAPTLSGSPPSERPNVVLYFVDGFGAEYMSLYGYNLNTTPNLERLAAEGALFERAYTNSRWTTPSTTTFMTSLQHSVVGGSRAERLELPPRVVTMAQHFHRAGYQTAVLTGNPSAARTAGLGREVDVLRDWVRWDGSLSSPRLQAAFWNWRDSYPGSPYWVHFQTIDVWGPGWFEPGTPFSGTYVSASERQKYWEMRETLQEENPGHWWRPDQEAFDEAAIDRMEYYQLGQRIYAEAIAAQDHQIGRFVDQLKAAGEWENTLFIVASDHGQHESGLTRLDPYAPRGQHTNLRPEHTGIPLLFVWPGNIPRGVRFRTPVSMIDLLPTVLELAGRPLPDVMQGRSLAPLLTGAVPESRWEPQPVILDEFYVDEESGSLKGWIEVVDGRWGASLEIGAPVEPAWARRGEYDDAIGGRPTPLLVYDLWNDPRSLHTMNDERPELVERYRMMLEGQFEAHTALREHVGTSVGDVELTVEQLEMLRSLGYIQ
jgi:arylsulfatase A-like enzyme